MYSEITKIEIQKNDNERVNIFINNEFAFACNLELVYKHKIEKGTKITLEELMEIEEEEEYIRCKKDALRAVERTSKSEKELVDKLILKGYKENVINKVVDLMKNYGFIDDTRFCEIYVKDKMSQWGKNKIKFELMKKGIADEIIQYKLSSITEENEKSQAMELVEKKLKSIISNEKDKKKLYKKLGDFLISKGYNYEITKEVLGLLLKDLPLEQEENNEFSIKSESELYKLAEKRYNIISKSEKDDRKIYKKLSDYLLRKGYKWDEIKEVLKEVILKEGDI